MPKNASKSIERRLFLRLSSADFLNVLSKRLGRSASDFLDVDVEGEFLVVRPKAFLGSELFSDVLAVVKEYGGEYVSNGKLSHFRVPLGNVSGLQSEKAEVSQGKFVRVPADLLGAIDKQLGVLSDLLKRLKEEAKNV